jgi:hypothetical protein
MPPTKSKNTELLNNLDKVIGSIVDYIDSGKLSSDQKKALKELLAKKKTVLSSIKSLINGTKRKIPSNVATGLIGELDGFLGDNGLKKLASILMKGDEGRHIKCSLLYHIFLTANAKKGVNYSWGLSNYLYNLTFTTNKIGRPDGMFVDAHFIQVIVKLYDDYSKLKSKYRVLDGDEVVVREVKLNSVKGAGTFYSMAILRDMQPVDISRKLVGEAISDPTHLLNEDGKLSGYILTKQALNSLIKAVLSMMRIMGYAVYTTSNDNGKKSETVELLEPRDGENYILTYVKKLLKAKVVINTKRPGDDKYTPHKFVEIFTKPEEGSKNLITGSFVAGLTRVVKISNYFKNTFKVGEQEVKVPTLNSLYKFSTKKASSKPRKEGAKISNVESFYRFARGEESSAIQSIGDSIRVSNLLNVVALADKVSHQLPITLYSEQQ